MTRALVLPVLSALLLGCAGGAAQRYSWPEAGAEPRPWPVGAGALATLEARFGQAGTQPLGSRDDQGAVVVLTLRDLAHPLGRVEDVRWLGAEVALAQASWQTGTPLGGQRFLYVLQKEKGQWQVFRRYLMRVLPGPGM